MTYRPPEGYLFDPDTGLYYSQVIASDRDGNRSRVVTWFDCDTGKYRQEIYPLESSAELPPDKVIAKRTSAAPPRTERAEPGKTPTKKNMVWLIAVPAVLVIVLAVFAGVMIHRHIKNKADQQTTKAAVDVVDRTVNQSPGETGADSQGSEEIPAEPEPEPEAEEKTETAEEAVQETDSAVTAEYTQSGLANCYGVDEDELLKANMTVMDLTLEKQFCNGEMNEWFAFTGISEEGIKQVFFHAEPLNNETDVREYYVDVVPMGSKFSSIYDEDCIETKVRGGGLEITFYVHINGSTEIDAQSEVIDENAHAGYDGFGFGKGNPADYYQM